MSQRDRPGFDECGAGGSGVENGRRHKARHDRHSRAGGSHSAARHEHAAEEQGRAETQSNHRRARFDFSAQSSNQIGEKMKALKISAILFLARCLGIPIKIRDVFFGATMSNS